MKKESKKLFFVAAGFFLAFVLWTWLVLCFDVQTVGPNCSQVGLATLNCFVHSLTGVSMALYTVTDWLGLVPIFVALGFALLGLCQWIGRRNIRKVDFDILALGGFYIATAAVYIFFEYTVINYRPTLIEGLLEASYPSSTTVLVLCVMPTAIMQFWRRIKNRFLRRLALAASVAFTVFMPVARLLSGVHWFSDIVGGVLISAALVCLYVATCVTAHKPKNR